MVLDAALVAAVGGLCGVVLNKLRCRLLTSARSMGGLAALASPRSLSRYRDRANQINSEGAIVPTTLLDYTMGTLDDRPEVLAHDPEAFDNQPLADRAASPPVRL